jgi:glycosyltransferase involved in cell wall biosynthesis
VITEARWIAETLEALAPERRCLLVRNGVAKEVFTPPDAPPVRIDGPLRILVEGPVNSWFKGVPEALAAARAMTEPHHVTAVTPQGAALKGPDSAIGPLSQAELANAYADADVVLKLSRVEGMFGPPLEGFHKGATCVVSPVTGHDEYVVHGENGLVVDWDDPAGTARALDLVARDRALLHRLRCGALATARSWPSWEQQGQVMAAALLALRREPGADTRRAGRRLARDMAGVLSDTERAASELTVARQKAAQAQSSRAYRAAVKGRTTIENVVRAPGRWRKRRRGEL